MGKEHSHVIVKQGIKIANNITYCIPSKETIKFQK